MKIGEDQARTTSIIGSCCPAPQARTEALREPATGRTRERSLASRQVRRRERPSGIDVDRRFDEAGEVEPGAAWLASGVLQTHARGESPTRAAERRQPQLNV